jgi:hypothetical protein
MKTQINFIERRPFCKNLRYFCFYFHIGTSRLDNPYCSTEPERLDRIGRERKMLFLVLSNKISKQIQYITFLMAESSSSSFSRVR